MDASVPIFPQTLSPLERDLFPAGDCHFEELVEEYRLQLCPDRGPVHLAGMTSMAQCRAAILAAGEKGCGPVWVSWQCDEEGESPTGVQMLAALIVAEGMGAAAFGVECPRWEPVLARLAPYASIPLFWAEEGRLALWDYEPGRKDPDSIPCATGTQPCFVTRMVDVGEELECGPDLLEDIIAAGDDPVGAVKIAVLDSDDVEVFAREQYAVDKALCLWADVPDLLESALRVYQGRALYDGTGELEPEELERLVKRYGLNVL